MPQTLVLTFHQTGLCQSFTLDLGLEDSDGGWSGKCQMAWVPSVFLKLGLAFPCSKSQGTGKNLGSDLQGDPGQPSQTTGLISQARGQVQMDQHLKPHP